MSVTDIYSSLEDRQRAIEKVRVGSLVFARHADDTYERRQRRRKEKPRQVILQVCSEVVLSVKQSIAEQGLVRNENAKGIIPTM